MTLGLESPITQPLLDCPMKYLLSFLLFLCAFSLQSLQAATSTQEGGIGGALSEDILNSTAEIVGIGRIAEMVREISPIQALAAIARPDEANARAAARRTQVGGRMGARLVSLMSDTMAQTNTVSTAEDDASLAISSEIIGEDTDANAGMLQEGRMYTPKLVIDYQKFPVPTYGSMSADVQQKRITRLNSQLQKRFGNTVKVDYRDDVHYLRGNVVSEQQKEVLELFLKMEPGVQKVKNEIAVAE